MDKDIIKETIKEMIIKGELKFVLDKGEFESTSPSGNLLKRIPTAVLKVNDEDDSTLAISTILLADNVWNIND